MKQLPPPGERRADAWHNRQRRRPSQWLRKAQQLGLREDPRSSVFTLQGRIHGVFTVVERQPRGGALQPPPGQEKLEWRWTISHTGLRFRGRLALAPETTLSGLAKLVTGQDVLCGDPEFDAAALVKGDPDYALAVLSRNVRRTLVVALERGVTFAADSLTWAFWDRTMPRRVLSRARVMARLADRLVLEDHEVWPALLRNSVRDPLTRVRRHNLDLLASFDGEPDLALIQAASAGAATDDPKLVATAAKILARAVEANSERLELLSEAGLVALLKHGRSEHRLRLLERLTEVGTSWSLGPIGEAGRGLLTGRRLREAARAATAAIIARAGGLKEGGLSLLPAAAGDLSLIPGEEAGLEFAD